MTSESQLEARFSPLHDLHVAAGASFTDFGGWQMPVRYSSDLAEHHAVRTAAGLFDISHMAEIEVSGVDAAAFLDWALAGQLSAVAIGRAKYTLLLAPEGGIVDDLIVYRRADDRFLVVANAGNRDAVVAALNERVADFDVTVTDQSDDISLIAVQGPNAQGILLTTPGLVAPGIPDLKYYAAEDGTFDGADLMIGRTGYTGEDGFELFLPVAKAADLWNRLLEAGADRGLIPCGLAARDTLRLEAGMPLYGHELTLDTLPVQAGLGRVVALAAKGDFVGRPAVEAGPADGAPVLVGLVAEGKRAGRAEYPVLHGDDEVGRITSGALSPTLGYPIAMAYVDPSVSAVGTELDLDVRGTRVPAHVISLPFYKRSN